MTPYYADSSVTLHHGDCLDVLRELPDASVDAVVTDPPYGLEFMGKEWDSFGDVRRANRGGMPNFVNEKGAPKFNLKAPAFDLTANGRNAFQQWCEEWAAECLRVLKPGGHMLAFGGTRTWHRLACAVEDAGFEVRDSIAWLYGSGFPKSLDVSKAIDKAGGDPLAYREFSRAYAAVVAASAFTHADIDRHLGIKSSSCYWAREDHRGGMPPRHHWEQVRALLVLSPDFERLYDEAEREVIGFKERGFVPGGNAVYGAFSGDNRITAPATDAARTWQGWGTALKPAFEPVVVARKPLAGTVAANVLAHGTGALNIDGCRVGTGDDLGRPASSAGDRGSLMVHDGSHGKNSRADSMFRFSPETQTHPAGRWPGNVVLDEAMAGELDQQSGELHGSGNTGDTANGADADYAASSFHVSYAGRAHRDYGSQGGGASRFMYVAKADASERPFFFRPTCECEDAWPSTVRATDASESTADTCSSTSTSGSRATDARCPKGTTSTTSTATSSTTTSPTSYSSPSSTTSASTRDASSETASGGSPAASAESSSQSPSSTGTSPVKGGRPTGVVGLATSRAWSKTSVCGNCGAPARRESHATVKPLALMRWLVRLVTPPGGTVLEPFAGSGTTVEACILEGFHCVAVEREADYLPLIRQRINRRRDPVEAVKATGDDGGLFDLLDGGAA